jgi:hypothetical protein
VFDCTDAANRVQGKSGRIRKYARCEVSVPSGRQCPLSHCSGAL